MDLIVCLKTGCMAILDCTLDNGRFEGPYISSIKQQTFMELFGISDACSYAALLNVEKAASPPSLKSDSSGRKKMTIHYEIVSSSPTDLIPIWETVRVG